MVLTHSHNYLHISPSLLNSVLGIHSLHNDQNLCICFIWQSEYLLSHPLHSFYSIHQSSIRSVRQYFAVTCTILFTADIFIIHNKDLNNNPQLMKNIWAVQYSFLIPSNWWCKWLLWSSLSKRWNIKNIYISGLSSNDWPTIGVVIVIWSLNQVYYVHLSINSFYYWKLMSSNL